MPTSADQARSDLNSDLKSDLSSDLSYVRQAIATSERNPTPASIYLLWALVAAVGFPLLDLAPRFAPWFWLTAPAVGLLASLWLGQRHATAVGQLTRHEGLRHGLHWLGLILASALASLLLLDGRIGGAALGQVMLLLVALTYYLSGVHLDRAMFWVAGFAAVGFLAPFVMTAWVWTTIGAALFAGMATLALVSWRRGGRTAP